MRLNTIAVIAVTAISLFSPALAAPPTKPLPTAHVKNAISCFNCHQKEDPAKAAVPDESCMVCHGDYAAMAAYTKQLKPNPHDPPKKEGHPGFKCTDCHHQHKAPEVKCLECHTDFKMKMPL